jgi:hypothetical protein
VLALDGRKGYKTNNTDCVVFWQAYTYERPWQNGCFSAYTLACGSASNRLPALRRAVTFSLLSIIYASQCLHDDFFSRSCSLALAVEWHLYCLLVLVLLYLCLLACYLLHYIFVLSGIGTLFAVFAFGRTGSFHQQVAFLWR